MPLGGRQWLWGSSPASNDPQVSVIEIVTIWADGKKALSDLQNDTGACQFGALNLTAFKVVEKSATDFGATWRDGFGSFTAAHSRLVGDVLVSVTVTLPSGTAASTAAEATRLAGIAAERVQRTGLTKNGPVGNEVVPQPVATTEAEKAKVAADAPRSDGRVVQPPPARRRPRLRLGSLRPWLRRPAPATAFDLSFSPSQVDGRRPRGVGRRRAACHAQRRKNPRRKSRP